MTSLKPKMKVKRNRPSYDGPLSEDDSRGMKAAKMTRRKKNMVDADKAVEVADRLRPRVGKKRK